MGTTKLSDVILGTIIVVFALVWIVAEAMILSAKLSAFFTRILGKERGPTTYVENTLNQMYGDVRIEQREGSDFRKSAHAIKRR